MIFSAYFDGIMNVRVGDLISILRGREEENNKIRITKYELEPNKGVTASYIDKIQMEKPAYDFDPPIHCRVEDFQINDDMTTLSINPGLYLPSNVFIPSGDRTGGKDYLKAIFLNEVVDYVKICDKYISDETLKLLSDLNPGINVKLLGHSFKNNNIYSSIIQSLNKRGINVEIRKIDKEKEIHDRYILSKYYGYIIGHSLKDLGKSDTFISRLQDTSQIEPQFDNRWKSATKII